MLFDLMLCFATLVLGEIICAVACILCTKSREEGLGKSMFFAIPLAVIMFYLIRRRFNAIATMIQVLITSGTVFGLSYCWIRLLDFLPEFYTYDSLYITPIIACATFVFTKHFTDKIILAKYKSAQNKFTF